MWFINELFFRWAGFLAVWLELLLSCEEICASLASREGFTISFMHCFHSLTETWPLLLRLAESRAVSTLDRHVHSSTVCSTFFHVYILKETLCMSLGSWPMTALKTVSGEWPRRFSVILRSGHLIEANTGMNVMWLLWFCHSAHKLCLLGQHFSILSIYNLR
jgi:hypothetical protein